MHPYESTPEPTVNLLGPLAELVGWLTSTTLHMLTGILVGMLVARVMRQRHLRWTWAATACAPIALAHFLLGGWALTLDTAAVCAAARGRHWHREDLTAGGDLAEIAAARRGPLAASRMLWSALLESVGPAPVPALRQGRMNVGRTATAENVSIPFGATGGGGLVAPLGVH